MNVKKQCLEIVKILKKEYPDPEVALNYETPMQLLCAVILSAQCTDVRVNKVTEGLFKKYRSVADFSNADLRSFQNQVSSVSFYRNKSKNIVSSAKMIRDEFKSRIPDSMDDLLKLPGVARKTANVVLSEIYRRNEGICLDTHCIRLTQRWSLTKNKNPVKIEKELMDVIPKKDWELFSLLTIAHGRKVCKARKPDCKNCVLKKICPSAFKV